MNLPILWQTLYWPWVASEIIVLIVTRTGRSGGDIRDRGSLLILWPVIFFSVVAGTSIGEAYPHAIFNGAHWVRTASVALLAAALAFRWTAIFTLGRSFSVNVAIHAAQTLHKTGLYRFVRHPSYSGLLLILLAIARQKPVT